MPGNSKPPIENEPLILVPSHIKQDALDMSTDEQVRMAMRAYDGDVEAIYTIFDETFSWVRCNLNYPEAYHDWFMDMLQHLKATGKLNAIGKVPKGRGLWKDRRLYERDECIYMLILLQYQYRLLKDEAKPTWEVVYSDIDTLLSKEGLRLKDEQLAKAAHKKGRKEYFPPTEVNLKQKDKKQLLELREIEVKKLKQIFGLKHDPESRSEIPPK